MDKIDAFAEGERTLIEATMQQQQEEGDEEPVSMLFK